MSQKGEREEKKRKPCRGSEDKCVGDWGVCVCVRVYVHMGEREARYREDEDDDEEEEKRERDGRC